jgi:transcriptional regulator with PAS, ATPase and Fis domain
VKEGRFREDLFFRINVVTITIPPLRERKEDIPPLIEHFIEVFSRQNRKNIKGITQEARAMLLRYEFPGNVRELENIIERAIVITRSDYITIEDLPFQIQKQELSNINQGVAPLKKSVEMLERSLLKTALKEAQGNQSKAASLLGITERMLRYKLKKYGFKQ